MEPILSGGYSLRKKDLCLRCIYAGLCGIVKDAAGLYELGATIRMRALRYVLFPELYVQLR